MTVKSVWESFLVAIHSIQFLFVPCVESELIFIFIFMLIYLCIVCGLHMEVGGQPEEVVGFVFFPLREMGSKDRAHMARSG